jgi:hypothetical protein
LTRTPTLSSCATAYSLHHACDQAQPRPLRAHHVQYGGGVQVSQARSKASDRILHDEVYAPNPIREMFRRRVDSSRDRCASVCSKAFHNAQVRVHDQLDGCLLGPQPYRRPVEWWPYDVEGRPSPGLKFSGVSSHDLERSRYACRKRVRLLPPDDPFCDCSSNGLRGRMPETEEYPALCR